VLTSSVYSANCQTLFATPVCPYYRLWILKKQTNAKNLLDSLGAIAAAVNCTGCTCVQVCSISLTV